MPIVVYTEALGLGQGDPLISVAGTGTSIPRGIEALFEYNGVVLNDRSVIDKYRILQIDGLDDADIRDAREDRPAQHGESPLDAFYGGRTLALTGRIEAFQLAKLRDMQQALRTAFIDLTEKPFYFLTGDPATDHYINCRKFSKLQWTEVQTHKSAFFRDFVLTLRASDPRFYTISEVNTTLYPNLVPNPSFETNTTGWTATTTNFTSTTTARGTGWAQHGDYAYQLTGTKDNNSTERALILKSLTGTSGIPVTASQDYKMKATINVTNAGTKLFGFIEWYNSGGTLIGTTTYGTDHGSLTGILTATTEYTAPSTAAYAAIGVEARSNVALDVISIKADEFWFVEDHGQSGFGQALVINEGNFDSSPSFKIYGAMSNVRFTHPDGEFILDDSITNGQYYLVDTAIPTVVNSNGVNKFDSVNPVSDWPIVNAGQNVYQTECQCIGTSVNARIEFTHKNAYL